MPSTFFGLQIAYSGLKASNAALNTTANNVANVETDGYSRQKVITAAQAADVNTIIGIVFGEVSGQLANMKEQLVILNQELVGIEETSHKSIMNRNSTSLAIVNIFTAIYILFIILFLLINYRMIGKKVNLIADEINGIITDIQNNKGNLNSRITTNTSSELVHIKDGFNLFIETLQGILRQVKDGTVVLTESSDNMTSQIMLASDNITSTSAAL